MQVWKTWRVSVVNLMPLVLRFLSAIQQEELYEEERQKRMQADAEREAARKHHDYFT